MLEDARDSNQDTDAENMRRSCQSLVKRTQDFISTDQGQDTVPMSNDFPLCFCTIPSIYPLPGACIGVDKRVHVLGISRLDAVLDVDYSLFPSHDLIRAVLCCHLFLAVHTCMAR